MIFMFPQFWTSFTFLPPLLIEDHLFVHFIDCHVYHLITELHWRTYSRRRAHRLLPRMRTAFKFRCSVTYSPNPIYRSGFMSDQFLIRYRCSMTRLTRRLMMNGKITIYSCTCNRSFYRQNSTNWCLFEHFGTKQQLVNYACACRLRKHEYWP